MKTDTEEFSRKIKREEKEDIYEEKAPV